MEIRQKSYAKNDTGTGNMLIDQAARVHGLEILNVRGQY